MEGKRYIPLSNLDVYLLSREYSLLAWNIYQRLSWQEKKIIGDQMIESTDSIGANIAEGYGRYHYLDKNKFYINSRGSLLESQHWFQLLYERKKITQDEFQKSQALQTRISMMINKLISTQRQYKTEQK